MHIIDHLFSGIHLRTIHICVAIIELLNHCWTIVIVILSFLLLLLVISYFIVIIGSWDMCSEFDPGRWNSPYVRICLSNIYSTSFFCRKSGWISPILTSAKRLISPYFWWNLHACFPSFMFHSITMPNHTRWLVWLDLDLCRFTFEFL